MYVTPVIQGLVNPFAPARFLLSAPYPSYIAAKGELFAGLVLDLVLARPVSQQPDYQPTTPLH